MKIFLSYASKDRAMVTGLVEDLGLLDHEVWFDQDLSGGHRWWDAIIQSLQTCDLFVFALTPQALESVPCQLEYGYASDLGKRVLPVLLETVNTALLPTPLAQIQYVDYRARDHKAALLLNRALNALPPAEPLPDPLPVPPAVPLSPLAEANLRLDQPALGFDEQAALLLKLKNLFQQPDTKQDALALLMRFKQRQDLLARIDSELDTILGIFPSHDAFPVPAVTVEPPAVVRPLNLDFDGPVNERREPNGWFNSLGHVYGASARYTIRALRRTEGGQEGLGMCARLQSPADVQPDEFGSLMQRCAAAFLAGQLIRLEAEIRTEDVAKWAGMWLRADGDDVPNLLFDNMSQKHITGTTDWSTYVIEAQLPSQTTWLNYGIVLVGPGTVWADNFKLLVWQNNRWRGV